MKDLLSFARALVAARNRCRITQAEVGEHLGVSGSLVCQWEKLHAEPDANEVFAMEELLHVRSGGLSEHLGYVPLDEVVRLGYSLVAFLGDGRGHGLLKRLAEIHGLVGPDGLDVAWKFYAIWWAIPDGKFSDALKMAREYSDLTQYKLGQKIGVSQALISQWERSDHYRPRPDQIFCIEQALQRDPGSLSRLLGYVPIDDRYRLGLDLVTLFVDGQGPQLLKRLMELHGRNISLDQAS